MYGHVLKSQHLARHGHEVRHGHQIFDKMSEAKLHQSIYHKLNATTVTTVNYEHEGVKARKQQANLSKRASKNALMNPTMRISLFL